MKGPAERVAGRAKLGDTVGDMPKTRSSRTRSRPPSRAAPRSKVWLHCYDTADGLEVFGGFRPFDRVPLVGEHFVLKPGGRHYRVGLVIHLAYPDSRAGGLLEPDVAAEVWAFRVNDTAMFDEAGKGALTEIPPEELDEDSSADS